MELAEISEQTFAIMPNTTAEWMNCNKMWLQPENENDAVCRTCDTCHSQLEQCEDGGTHSLQYHQMACELATSAVGTIQRAGADERRQRSKVYDSDSDKDT